MNSLEFSIRGIKMKLLRDLDKCAIGWGFLIVLLIAVSLPLRAEIDLTEREFDAIDVYSEYVKFAVGNQGGIAHFSHDSSLISTPSIPGDELIDVHVGSPDFALAVAARALLQWDGDSWFEMDIDVSPAKFTKVWASHDQQLILLGTSEADMHRVCPWLQGHRRQPFCRQFNSPMKAACGSSERVLIVLKNGDIHQVNQALIGQGGIFEPVFHPAIPLELESIWIQDSHCESGSSLPDIYALATLGNLLRFDGHSWQEFGLATVLMTLSSHDE